jgi:hypothetical protein
VNDQTLTLTLTGALLLYKQFHSPACWRTVEVAEREYHKLKAKKDRLHCSKEQILMRYLGLGWVEAHHRWSSKGRTFTADELFDHSIRVVIPLEYEPDREIRIEPLVDLPLVPNAIVIAGLDLTHEPDWMRKIEQRNTSSDSGLEKKLKSKKNLALQIKKSTPVVAEIKRHAIFASVVDWKI